MPFSQNAEEQHILNYFGDFVGTFLDIGCNDCVTLSNTRALALRGWKGILVDCSPQAIERCKKLYNGHKNFKIYPWAISEHNGKDIFQESGELLGVGDVGMVSTFHPEQKNRFKHVKYDPVEVKTYKWKTAINRWKVKKFDCVSIDVEGDELNILPYMDLTDTRLLCIEWNSIPELKTEFEKYLGGFHIIYTSTENLIFAR